MLTAQQQAVRLNRVTSSIAAGALGIHPFMTPLEAWMSITARSPDIGAEKPIVRGNLLEAPVLDYPLYEIPGLRREPAPFRVHPRHDWAGDSADALYYMGDDLYAVGEGKTAAMGSAAGWGDEGTDEIPLYHLVQCHWHLDHWREAPACLTPALIGGYAFEFRLYRVERDDDVAGDIVQRLEKWHRDYVVNDVMPPASAGDEDALRHMFPRASLDAVPATDELEKLAREKVEASEAFKAAEARKSEVENKLRQALGLGAMAKGDGWYATYKNNKPTLKTDWKAVALELGANDETIARHTTEKEGARVLRVVVK